MRAQLVLSTQAGISGWRAFRETLELAISTLAMNAWELFGDSRQTTRGFSRNFTSLRQQQVTCNFPKLPINPLDDKITDVN